MAMMHIKFSDVYFPVEGVSVGKSAAWWAHNEIDGATVVHGARVNVVPDYNETFEVTNLEGTVTTHDGVEHPITLDPTHEMGMFILDAVGEGDMRLAHRNGKFYAYIKELKVDI